MLNPIMFLRAFSVIETIKRSHQISSNASDSIKFNMLEVIDDVDKLRVIVSQEIDASQQRTVVFGTSISIRLNLIVCQLDLTVDGNVSDVIGLAYILELEILFGRDLTGVGSQISDIEFWHDSTPIKRNRYVDWI